MQISQRSLNKMDSEFIEIPSGRRDLTEFFLHRKQAQDESCRQVSNFVASSVTMVRASEQLLKVTFKMLPEL